MKTVAEKHDTIEIILPRHKEKLNSGKCKVIALKDSYIEGYFLKGDLLEVERITGTMLSVKNDKGYRSMVSCKKVLLVKDFADKVYCESCGTLDENKHLWSCDIVKQIVDSVKEEEKQTL